MTQANDETQRLGPHYASRYQHWDFVLNVGMDYLAAAATKYAIRWREKGGQNDLQKALHYTNKLLENAALVMARRPILPDRWLDEEIIEFCETNRLGTQEAKFLRLMTTWMTRDDLMSAQGVLITLMEVEDVGDPMQPGSGPSPEEGRDIDEAMRALIAAAPGGAAPVPVEDSNRHAERAFQDRTGPAADYLASDT